MLEHLFLRGTSSMAGSELTKWIDSRGGVLTPFTTRELTALVTQVLSRNWRDGLGALVDMAGAPGFTGSDVEVERPVVFEELRSTQGRPEQLAYDWLHAVELGAPASTGL